MAYDFGTKGLGITNPFKVEGLVRSVGGLLITLLGVYSLFKVVNVIEQNMVAAWVFAGFGFVLLAIGLKRFGSGLFQLFKFFVGRSVPTSLAYNHARSEKENAHIEKKNKVLAYHSNDLESMLMGRKNSTFSEPQGWMGRFVHSILPKLIFLPYPVRNITQQLINVLTTTIIAFVAFGLTYFVASSGLAGEAGHIIIPAFSVIILLYLVAAWRKASKSVSLNEVKQLQSTSSVSLAKVIAVAIVFPVLIGFIYHQVVTQLTTKELTHFSELTDKIELFSAWPSLSLLLVLAALSTALLMFMVFARAAVARPLTEVSEFRANMQESVHPNEIFINIENIVLANRRYKEIPNRMYKDFDPVLNEQSQGKGSFYGELLIETQPEYKAVEYPKVFQHVRMASTVLAQVFIVAAAFMLFGLTDVVIEIFQFFSTQVSQFSDYQRAATRANNIVPLQNFFAEASALVAVTVGAVFSWLILSAMGRMLENFSHVFWAELQFDSLLMYMKTEGTFSESKISTGMAITDSTRSENVIVRSSITPWIISSRITSSTYATSGGNNVEMPRYIMSMTQNERELATIVDEIKAFLRERENIAGFTNHADLQHAENILKVNQASRNNQEQLGIQSEQAGGYIRQQDEQDKLTEQE